MKLAIGSDNGTVAVEMRTQIKEYLLNKGIEVLDVGENVNYPVTGYEVCKLVVDGSVDGGVLICGTGIGMSLVANKVKGIRACACSEPYSAKLSK